MSAPTPRRRRSSPAWGLALLAAPLLAAPIARAESAEGYRMNDLGGTVKLPAGYENDLWADWELKSKSSRGVLFKLWLSEYQVPVNADSLAAWAAHYKEELEDEGVSQVQIARTEMNDRGGRRTGMVTLSLQIAGGAGVAYYAFFEGAGHTVHLRTVSAASSTRAAEADLDAILAQMQLDGGPLSGGDGTVSTAAGFQATLPEGWRLPVGKEIEPIRKITAKMGEAELAEDRCWTALHPNAAAEPDLLFACKTGLQVGPLDEYSFDAVEAEVHARYFGRAETPVAAAKPVPVGDRTGLLYSPPVAGQPVKLALAPYAASMMQLWGRAGALDEAGLEAAVTQTLAATRFTGDDGGKPIIGFDSWVGYYLKHRPTSPLVLGPGLLLVGLVGGGAALSRRKRPDADLD